MSGRFLCLRYDDLARQASTSPDSREAPGGARRKSSPAAQHHPQLPVQPPPHDTIHHNYGRSIIPAASSGSQYGHSTYLCLLLSHTHTHANNSHRSGAWPPPAVVLLPAVLSSDLAVENAVTASPLGSHTPLYSCSTQSFLGSCSPTGL